jgi:hypothetical protein
MSELVKDVMQNAFDLSTLEQSVRHVNSDIVPR